MGFIQNKMFEAVEKGVENAVTKMALSAASHTIETVEKQRNRSRAHAFYELVDGTQVPYYFVIRGFDEEFSVLSQGDQHIYTGKVKCVPNSYLSEVIILNKKDSMIGSVRQLNTRTMHLFYNRNHIGDVVRTSNYRHSDREYHIFNGWLINSATVEKKLVFTVSNNTIPILRITHKRKLREHMYLTEFLGNCDADFAVLLSFCVLLEVSHHLY